MHHYILQLVFNCNTFIIYIIKNMLADKIKADEVKYSFGDQQFRKL